jgi:hypothetical protein
MARPLIHVDSCGPDVPISRAASTCAIPSASTSALHRAASSAGRGSACALPGAAFAVGAPCAAAGIGALIGWSFDELRGYLRGKQQSHAFITRAVSFTVSSTGCNDWR